MSSRKSNVRYMVATAMIAAVMCLVGPLVVPTLVSIVPVSFTTLIIYLGCYILGRRWGTVATLLYILIGSLGLPVFSGYTGGAGCLAGPTGGYIIGYIFMAFFTGYFVEHYRKRPMRVLGMIIGTFSCYLLGSVWLGITSGGSFKSAFVTGTLMFIPIDTVKIVIACMIGPSLRHAFRDFRHS